jgi:hypothetical protein
MSTPGVEAIDKLQATRYTLIQIKIFEHSKAKQKNVIHCQQGKHRVSSEARGDNHVICWKHLSANDIVSGVVDVVS